MKGKPILGGISGLFFGLFVGLDLFLFGVVALDSPLLYILPPLGLAGGIGLAAWAPLGGGKRVRVPTPDPLPAPDPEPAPDPVGAPDPLPPADPTGEID